MRKYLFICTAFVLFSRMAAAQAQYEVLPDKEGSKLFKGIISREILLNDSACAKWYAENEKGFTPHAGAVSALKNNINTIQLLVFMGTWCGDSKTIIPRFFSLLDSAGFPAGNVTLIATDRNKKTLSHLAEALGITLVPTIMVMKNGKELGRVVEFGKYGMFDKELGEIINSMDAVKPN